MIDYGKIREYMTSMAANTDGTFKLSDFAISEMLGGKMYISAKDLHEGFEYTKAKMKKDVEENLHAAPKQKEAEKNKGEFILKFLEEQIKRYLKSQNRLL